MALTLVEASKLHSGDVLRSAVTELYARSSDVLMALPFDNITGNALRYNREDKLPGVGFRGVNEAYGESTGILNPQVEMLSIAGGDLDVDTFILQTMGADQRSVQEAMKIRALALRWTKAFVKGDNGSDPREFDGIQGRVAGNQLIENNAGTGAALSLAKLDELIDQVTNPTHLLMNKGMRRRLTQSSRNTSVSGYITHTKDEYGRQLTMYNDLPVLVVDEDEAGNQIMPFNEAAAGGGTSSTSIYCVSFGEGMFQGIQNGDITARDLGELQSKPAMRTRVEWFAGIAIMHGKALARLRGITDSAVTA